MDDAESNDRLRAGSGYNELPGRHVTINQIVAWNLAYWRRVAALTQEELGELLGWSKVVVSAAERSWDSKRIRNFTADDLINIAHALDVPASALLFPPSDDGNDMRYLFHAQPKDADCLSMYDLLRYAVSDPPADNAPVANRYRDRYATAFNFYFGAGPEDDLKYYKDMTTEERVVSRLAQLRGQYDALRDILSDNDKLQDLLYDKLAELRHDQPGRTAWARMSPAQRAYQQALGEITRELFGRDGVNRAELEQVTAEASRRGIVPPSEPSSARTAAGGTEDEQ